MSETKKLRMGLKEHLAIISPNLPAGAPRARAGDPAGDICKVAVLGDTSAGFGETLVAPRVLAPGNKKDFG